MLFQLVLGFALLCSVQSQAEGNGIGKSTYAASNTTHTYAWMMNYFPVHDADDSCRKNKCTCGTQGRVTLDTYYPSRIFGIHTVDAWGKDYSRGNASGSLTIADMEAIFDQEIDDFSTFSPFSDYNTGFWSTSLDDYVKNFKADNVPFRLYSYTYKSKTYYSLLTRITGSQVVFELISDAKPSDVTVTITATKETRHAFEKYTPSGLIGGHLVPLKISRGTGNMTRLVNFYKTVFNVDPIWTETLKDGTDIRAYQLDSSATVQIRFVQRPLNGKLLSKETPTPAWFEKYLNEVNNKYMTSYKSCWDVWGDNHYAYDTMSVSGDDVISLYEKNNWKYHLFSFNMLSEEHKRRRRNVTGPGNMVQGYFADPTGWQIQLDAQYSNAPSDAESFSPDYCFTSCVSTDL